MNHAALPVMNRRLAPSRFPKRSLKVACRKGLLAMGPNLGKGVLDLSETEIRLLLTAPLDQGQLIELTLSLPYLPRTVKALAEVLGSTPAADGTYCVGARFEKRLPYADFVELTQPPAYNASRPPGGQSEETMPTVMPGSGLPETVPLGARVPGVSQAAANQGLPSAANIKVGPEVTARNCAEK